LPLIRVELKALEVITNAIPHITSRYTYGIGGAFDER
jgi:hypothetical protein